MLCSACPITTITPDFRCPNPACHFCVTLPDAPEPLVAPRQETRFHPIINALTAHPAGLTAPELAVLLAAPLRPIRQIVRHHWAAGRLLRTRIIGGYRYRLWEGTAL